VTTDGARRSTPIAPPPAERLPSPAVSTASPSAAPAGSLLDNLERRAWGIPLPTRRLFVLLAWVTAAVLVVASLTATYVTARNEDTIRAAREQGLGIARAATSFRTHLAAADAQAAGTLLAGGLETPDDRAQYDRDILQASRALTAAGLVSTGDDSEDIGALADGLVRYAGLVETSRANSRLGYPVGAAYLAQARALANDDLVPRAERLRRVGEQRVARAANAVGGVTRTLAIVLLILAIGTVLATSAVVAGRTRRALQPALVVGAVAVVAVTVFVTAGISRQSSQLRTAATDEIDGFVAANDVSFALSQLRVTEFAAVAARGSGAAIYQTFRDEADALTSRLEEQRANADLRSSVADYVAAAGAVQATDEGGDNRAAAQAALTGGSATAFAAADKLVGDEVDGASDALANRFERAADAQVPPLIPLVLGLAAAMLALAGILARGRRYR